MKNTPAQALSTSAINSCMLIYGHFLEGMLGLFAVSPEIIATTGKGMDRPAHQNFAEPHHVGEYQVVCTAWIGVVGGKANYEHPEEVLHNAVITMYHAEVSSKDDESCAQCFEAGMHMQKTLTRRRAHSPIEPIHTLPCQNNAHKKITSYH